MREKLVMAVAVLAIIAAAVIVPNAMATGNGAPSGNHYNLNLIGKDKTDILPNDVNNGHRIFVNEYGNSKIYLYQGDFAVLDADATDGRGAFQLPKPETVVDETTGEVTSSAYTVWIRPVGKPGGSGSMKTCATYTYIDPVTGLEVSEEVCSTEQVILIREKGQSTFQDVTKQLTTIYVDLDGDGTSERYNIFDDALQDYLWSYDSNGLKIVQLRFYPTS